MNDENEGLGGSYTLNPKMASAPWWRAPSPRRQPRSKPTNPLMRVFFAGSTG